MTTSHGMEKDSIAPEEERLGVEFMRERESP